MSASEISLLGLLLAALLAIFTILTFRRSGRSGKLTDKLDQMNIWDATIKRQEAELAFQKELNAKLTEANTVLTEAVTSKADVAGLTSMVIANQKELLKYLRRIAGPERTADNDGI